MPKCCFCLCALLCLTLDPWPHPDVAQQIRPGNAWTRPCWAATASGDQRGSRWKCWASRRADHLYPYDEPSTWRLTVRGKRCECACASTCMDVGAQVCQPMVVRSIQTTVEIRRLIPAERSEGSRYSSAALHHRLTSSLRQTCSVFPLSAAFVQLGTSLCYVRFTWRSCPQLLILPSSAELRSNKRCIILGRSARDVQCNHTGWDVNQPLCRSLNSS